MVSPESLDVKILWKGDLPMATWDPATYLHFADERSRPFVDLTQRVGATAPRTIVDLGCGPGQLTATLAERWPSAQVVGLDSSPEMIERAQEHASARLTFRVARFTAATRGVERPEAFGADVYLADLAASGLSVDAWETTYLHVLTSEDPVFTWISGTGGRPVLQALSDEQRGEFVAEYKALLRGAYPLQPFGTVLPFRRVFVVAHQDS